MPAVHMVRQGECISSIAYEYGFFPETIWNYSDNAALKILREDGNVLYEGDEIVIPDKRVKELNKSTDAEHRFKLKGVPAKFSLRFVDQGKPRDNVPFRLIIDGKERKGRTDGEGYVNASIPPGAGSGRLFLGNPGEEQEFDLQFGVLDPIETERGVLQRLTQLGFPCEDAAALTDEQAKTAIYEFQKYIGHPEPNGQLDEQTRKCLSSLNERP
jgi:hypothetical protein